MRIEDLCGGNRAKHYSLVISLIMAVLAASISLATIQSAEAAAKFAAITVDAHNGKILLAKNIDVPRYPASLTKIMTLYLLFQDLESGKIKLNSRLRVSKRAASRQPSSLGLKPNSSIRVSDAIKALIIKSANDVASVIAEGLADSEADFARRMTQTARTLGMTRTTFANASGLPNRTQLTTARDMATLSLHIQKDFPQYYKYFSARSFKYKGRKYKTHNRLLGQLKGIDGIKTGYTKASGFNLASSVKRKGRHVVGVVMGGRSGKSRNSYMTGILKKALKKVPYRKRKLIASTAGTPPKAKSQTSRRSEAKNQPVGAKITTKQKAKLQQTAIALKPKNSANSKSGTDIARGETWQIQIGAFSSTQDAISGLARARNTGLKALVTKKSLTLEVEARSGTLYRARFTGFDRRQATSTCTALTRRAIKCLAIAPRS